MHATQFGRTGAHNYRNNPGRKFQGQQDAPAAKASVLRIVNFKRLAEAAGGAESLGSLLGLTVGRLKELEDGRDFSDETAFYLEHELDLPSGWFDQKEAPVPAVIERREEVEEQNSSQGLDVSRKVEQNKVLADAQPARAGHKGKDSEAAKEPSVTPTPEPTSGPSLLAKAETLEVAPMTTSSVTDAVLAARMMRRSNLTALTSWPKSKSGLARLLNKTPANVSHLIHGEKNFDREAALEIERVTGLPENWFEAPRTASDVPQLVVTKLTGSTSPGMPAAAPAAPAVEATSRKRGRPRKAPEAVPEAAAKPAGKKAKPAPVVAAAPVAPPAQATLLPAAVLPGSAADAQPRRRGRPRKNPLIAPAVAAAKPTGISAPVDTAVALPVGPVMTEATRRQLRESEGQMGPIAEALVKTIIEKSRSGSLSEKAAYKMLSEVMDK